MARWVDSRRSPSNIKHVQCMKTLRFSKFLAPQDLTLTLTGDFVDELAKGYSQPWFQELLKRCCEECADREKFLERLQDVAFEARDGHDAEKKIVRSSGAFETALDLMTHDTHTQHFFVIYKHDQTWFELRSGRGKASFF